MVSYNNLMSAVLLLWVVDLDSMRVAWFGMFAISRHPPIKLCSRTLGLCAPDVGYTSKTRVSGILNSDRLVL